MPIDTWRRSGLLFVRLTLGLLTLSVLALLLLLRHSDDLRLAYLPAAEAIVNGRSVYYPEMLEGPFSAILRGAFIYPPISAALWIPLAAAGPTIAVWAFFLIELLLLGGLLLASRPAGRVLGRADYLLPGLLLLLSPAVFADLNNQNVGLPVVALSLAALTLARRHPVAAAALLLLGVLIKPTAALAAIPLLGLWASGGRTLLLRGLSATLLGGLALVGISLLLWPNDTLAYPTVLANLSAGGLTLVDANIARLDIGLTGLIAELLGVARSEARLPALLLGGMAALGALWLGYRRAPIAALGAVAIVGMALSTTTWIHHLIALGLLSAWVAWRRHDHQALPLFVGVVLLFDLIATVSPVGGLWQSFVPAMMILLTAVTAALELRTPAPISTPTQPARD